MKQKTKEQLRAVFDIDFYSFMSLSHKGLFDLSLCKDNEDIPYPLHYITLCWDIIFGYLDEWKEEYKPILKKRKEENDKFKNYFCELGLDMSGVPFSQYSDLFYCQDMDAPIESCLCVTEEELKKRGIRDIDIELACCVEKFQLDRVEHLLESGADPYQDCYDDEDYNSFIRIDNEIEFILSEFQNKVLGKSRLDDLESDMSYLWGLAAHEKMYHLLDKYSEIQ